MHKRILSLPAALIAGFSLLAGSASALDFGVGPIGGVNLSNISYDADGEDVDTEMKTGFGFGARAEFGVTSPFSLLLEPMFLQRGYTLDMEILPGMSLDVETSLNYLEMPVLAKAKFGSMKAHGYAIAGPSLGIFLNGTAESGDESEDAEDISTLNISGEIGVGGAFQLQEFVYLNADVRYSYGFTNMNSNDDIKVDAQNRDIKLMVCVLFHLTK